MGEIESSYNTQTSSNGGYNSASALQIRLETNGIIENIEMFLRGAIIVVNQDEKTGKITSSRVNKGQPKASDQGIQSILNWIQLILNPQVVQGNFPVDAPGHSSMYEEYIYAVRMDLTMIILNNCYKWNIADEDIELLIDSIMNAVEPFMTRLIDNKERESYDQTVKHVEHNTLKEGKESFSIL